MSIKLFVIVLIRSHSKLTLVTLTYNFTYNRYPDDHRYLRLIRSHKITVQETLRVNSLTIDNGPSSRTITTILALQRSVCFISKETIGTINALRSLQIASTKEFVHSQKCSIAPKLNGRMVLNSRTANKIREHLLEVLIISSRKNFSEYFFYLCAFRLSIVKH